MKEDDQNKPDSENIAEQSNDSTQDRRKTLRRILVGGGVITSGSVLPEKWSSAVVQSVVLPAHAQVSGINVGNFNGQGAIP